MVTFIRIKILYPYMADLGEKISGNNSPGPKGMWLEEDINNMGRLEKLKFAKLLHTLLHSSLDTEKVYNERFSTGDIMKMNISNVSYHKSAEYPEHVDLEEAINLSKSGCTPEIFESYNLQRFSPMEVAQLYRVGCLYKLADKYGKRFNGFDIAHLVMGKCPPKRANMYYRTLKKIKMPKRDPLFPESWGLRIATLNLIQLTPEIINGLNNKRKRNIAKTFSSIEGAMWSPHLYGEKVNRGYVGDYSLLEVGGSAVILHKKEPGKEAAWKFSKNSFYEARLLLKLNEPKNVVRLKNREAIASSLISKDKIAIELEYIYGATLEDYIGVMNDKSPERKLLNAIFGKENYPSKRKILKYSADILNGIHELRQAGIYHRDLHGKNIMHDRMDDKMVIIDLDAATENPKEVHNLNRLYGGNNDLISLGQLMYKMMTGNNLFNEGREFSYYSTVKNKVKTVRERAYDTPSLKQEYLSKIKTDVLDALERTYPYGGILSSNPLNKPLSDKSNRIVEEARKEAVKYARQRKSKYLSMEKPYAEKISNLIVKLLDRDLWTQPSMNEVEEMRGLFRRYAK
jgi:serine/threonine protein kinase